MWRSVSSQILKDLEKKIVFLSGPRQVGKTWLAKHIANKFEKPVYLNYDNLEDKKIIEARSWLPSSDFLVLDELHKMPEWKNYLKGLFDTKEPQLKILVTGSARLETFRQSGDSLAGRFFRLRLLPFSLKELQDKTKLDRLITRGGFPEPFLSESDTDSERWRQQYLDGLIRTDILDFEKIHDFKAISLLLKLLRSRVGSPLSKKSLAQDIAISQTTVAKYLDILESLFIIFRVYPYSKNIARSLLKEAKVYFYDSAMVQAEEAQVFENVMALSLLKHCYGREDIYAKQTRLHYLRTKEGKEVDFCLVEDEEVKKIIEVKLNSDQAEKSFYYFQKKYNFEAVLVSRYLRQERQTGKISIRRAEEFLGELDF